MSVSNSPIESPSLSTSMLRYHIQNELYSIIYIIRVSRLTSSGETQSTSAITYRRGRLLGMRSDACSGARWPRGEGLGSGLWTVIW